MNLISFDVGIKNMSYCIFEIHQDGFVIKDWNVLNLMDETHEIQKCNAINISHSAIIYQQCTRKKLIYFIMGFIEF